MEWNNFASSGRVKLPGWHFFPLHFFFIRECSRVVVVGRVKREVKFVRIRSASSHRQIQIYFLQMVIVIDLRCIVQRSIVKKKEAGGGNFKLLLWLRVPDKEFVFERSASHLQESRDCFWWRMVLLKIPWNLYISIMLVADLASSSSFSFSFSGAARWWPTDKQQDRKQFEENLKVVSLLRDAIQRHWSVKV